MGWKNDTVAVTDEPVGIVVGTVPVIVVVGPEMEGCGRMLRLDLQQGLSPARRVRKLRDVEMVYVGLEPPVVWGVLDVGQEYGACSLGYEKRIVQSEDRMLANLQSFAVVVSVEPGNDCRLLGPALVRDTQD